MKVYYHLCKNLQMFKFDEASNTCKLLPNALLRHIHFCVDQLSARNFRFLLINITKQLTHLHGHKTIILMIEALKQFTCTHDLFHETRIQRADVIYRSHYGGFLQAFQCHLKVKGITGITKNKVQLHEQFLFLVDNAHRRLQMKKYLMRTDASALQKLPGEPGGNF